MLIKAFAQKLLHFLVNCSSISSANSICLPCSWDFSSLFRFNFIDPKKWEEVETKGAMPASRYGHTATSCQVGLIVVTTVEQLHLCHNCRTATQSTNFSASMNFNLSIHGDFLMMKCRVNFSWTTIIFDFIILRIVLVVVVHVSGHGPFVTINIIY